MSFWCFLIAAVIMFLVAFHIVEVEEKGINVPSLAFFFAFLGLTLEADGWVAPWRRGR